MANFTDEELNALRGMAATEQVTTRIDVDGKRMVATYRGEEYAFPLFLTIEKIKDVPDFSEDAFGFLDGICESGVLHIATVALENIVRAYVEAFKIANGVELGES